MPPKKSNKPPTPPAADTLDFEPVKEYITPDEQVKGLSEKELDEDHTRMLKSNNPNAPDNLTNFIWKDGHFKVQPMVDQTMFHFSYDGYVLHRDTEEGKQELAAIEAEKDAQKQREKAAAEAAKVAAAEGGDAAVAEADARALRNQFNYMERASQTFVPPLRDRHVQTEPPPVQTLQGSVSQWEMFDAYIEDLDKKAKEAEREKNDGKPEPPKPPEEPAHGASDVVHSSSMAKSLKTMERMVNQNSFDDIGQDYKYWEDASDQYREGEGTLLPLWRFYIEKCKRKHVTSLCWNTEYHDMFAAGYGSYDFLKQSTGLICCFSLKNPSYPEYIFSTESGVMCLDFHPQHSSLLAVGLYSGIVMVFDIRLRSNKPIFESSIKIGQHTDPVWQVRWQEEDLSKGLSFVSISSDGHVALWTMSKNELQRSDIMQLLMGQNKEADDGDDAHFYGLAGGCCFDFNAFHEHLFLVGTEEGRIHKCSTAYNSQYLETYEGHHMAVYTVNWNFYHDKIFLSASADWTVKLWDHTVKYPLMSFDLNNSVGDAGWAPYSSTVFAACTADGKVHVFDLNENKHESMCEQKVVRKAKCTKLSFNPKHPIVLVGDDKGCITSLKLSPNLRRQAKEPEPEVAKSNLPMIPVKQPGEKEKKKKDQKELELEKLLGILNTIDKPEAPQ